ncbi:uncharacterized protein MCYG_01258 [Microsporum canis CBS 113480]|uniref:DUF7735 domain-containing protein n=1 Tax=Arthroderma otae (strain ATCC MYA-4605 / CBS 113480) TaxID=554155 RepID=C5FEP6_ARTOC|nr:uncharacterized protein MCYG_01258 [Microsporum canis CBS 113480]EEQ28371.1 hypothetical protein MCYG_01258 [Microsporum canis CBS 113480]
MEVVTECCDAVLARVTDLAKCRHVDIESEGENSGRRIGIIQLENKKKRPRLGAKTNRSSYILQHIDNGLYQTACYALLSPYYVLHTLIQLGAGTGGHSLQAYSVAKLYPPLLSPVLSMPSSVANIYIYIYMYIFFTFDHTPTKTAAYPTQEYCVYILFHSSTSEKAMKTVNLLLLAASTATATRAFDDITTILPSQPTGALLTAIHSHGSELIKDCVSAIQPGMECPFPESSAWCGLSTAGPASLLRALSSYGSVASVWWSSHSSAAFSLAEMCPLRWYNAMLSIPGGWVWLNETIIYGGCYAEAHPTPSGTGSTGKQTATPGGEPLMGYCWRRVNGLSNRTLVEEISYCVVAISLNGHGGYGRPVWNLSGA